jgi:exosortase H (IPTLxxWG-CTERM-specific)
MTRFAIIFVVLLLLLFTLELTPPVQTYVVLPWTQVLTTLSAALMMPFDVNVLSYGKVLQNAVTGQGVSVEAGCNGVEACLILAAAILAYPASWRLRLWGLLLGFVAVQGVNVLRVISLYYLVGINPEWFKFAHLYLWQALIMLDVLVVWLLWIRQVAKREAQQQVKAQG